MFSEYQCGCIVGTSVGRVRICERHRPERADGVGGINAYPTGRVEREYSADGDLVHSKR